MMVQREISLPGRSFFLFGPRQTGKSTWLRSLDLGRSWTVNLLHNETYYRYLRDPSRFRKEADDKVRSGVEWIVLDEVQRIPELLDEVHALIESSDTRFILSGSSSRKLKRGGANLLGGRALLRRLHPFTVKELERSAEAGGFNLERALQFGTLPPLLGLSDADAADTLRAYVEIYLREEIQIEGLVRNLGGFTRFLDLSAAYCGEIVNFNSLAKESSLPHRTVQSYFEVLEDTLIAIRLPAWRRSPTKRLVSHPKVYLFDNGVTNALCRRLSAEPEPALRGRLFEQYMIQETNRRLDYGADDRRMYYWRTNHGAEVDLVIESAGRPIIAAEFKSRATIDSADLAGLRAFHADNPTAKCLVVCTAPEPWRLDFARVVPWRTYLEELESDVH